MKKRLGLVITIIIAALIIGLLVWRLWPQSSFGLISVNESTVTSFSAYGMFQDFEKGHCDLYSINSPEPLSNEPEEILEILATSKYQQDFRNLLPWGVDGVSADKNYDGNMVTLSLYFQDKEEYIEFQFLSNSLVVVRTPKQFNMRIYHPTNSITLDKLVEYLKNHGALQ